MEFILGANYWPRRRGPYMWKEFAPMEIAEELASARALGLDLLRVFLIWEDFQPQPDQVSGEALDKLEFLLDSAREKGIELMVTVFQGNMSGAFWWPEWALGREELEVDVLQVSGRELTRRKVRDLYKDEGMLAAERLLLTKLAKRFRKHPALWGWDLANELDQALAPASYEDGEAWLSSLRQSLREVDDNHPVTYGAHLPSLTSHNGLRLDAMARVLDIVSFHIWTIYADFAEGPMDLETALFVFYLASELAGKPVLVQEFGLPTAGPGGSGKTIKDLFLDKEQDQYLASEAEQADFIGRCLEAFYMAGAQGALVWCLFDFAPELWDRVPYDRCVRERSFGIVRHDLSFKSAAEVLRQFADDLARGTLGGQGSLKRKLEVDPDAYYGEPRMWLEAMLRQYRRR